MIIYFSMLDPFSTTHPTANWQKLTMDWALITQLGPIIELLILHLYKKYSYPSSMTEPAMTIQLLISTPFPILQLFYITFLVNLIPV